MATKKEDIKEEVKEQIKEQKPKTYIVKTPVPNYNGEVAGVQFAYGKAEVKEGWILSWFKEKGYEIEGKSGGTKNDLERYRT